MSEIEYNMKAFQQDLLIDWMCRVREKDQSVDSEVFERTVTKVCEGRASKLCQILEVKIRQLTDHSHMLLNINTHSYKLFY